MRLISIILLLIFHASVSLGVEQDDFKNGKKFKVVAIENNISEKTFDLVMSNVKFLPKVIEYDRFQPEFYEDTKTYISKRTSKKSKKRFRFL